MLRVPTLPPHHPHRFLWFQGIPLQHYSVPNTFVICALDGCPPYRITSLSVRPHLAHVGVSTNVGDFSPGIGVQVPSKYKDRIGFSTMPNSRKGVLAWKDGGTRFHVRGTLPQKRVRRQLLPIGALAKGKIDSHAYPPT